jgi:hypothetical protein
MYRSLSLASLALGLALITGSSLTVYAGDGDTGQGANEVSVPTDSNSRRDDRVQNRDDRQTERQDRRETRQSDRETRREDRQMNRETRRENRW